MCDQQAWIEISTTSFYVGSFIGNCLFGYVADKFGRRRSFFVILTVLIVCGTASSFAKDIESFIILRFFTGLAFPALFQIPFIICKFVSMGVQLRNMVFRYGIYGQLWKNIFWTYDITFLWSSYGFARSSGHVHQKVSI